MLFYLRCVYDVVTGMMFWLTLCFDWCDVLIDMLWVTCTQLVRLSPCRIKSAMFVAPLVLNCASLSDCSSQTVLRQDLSPLLWPPVLMTTHRPARSFVAQADCRAFRTVQHASFWILLLLFYLSLFTYVILDRSYDYRDSNICQQNYTETTTDLAKF